ncbi:glycosyltransferase family 2 protein [Isoptericola jiangsuensis]|uniref:glycosyltransferase family 2 protein n=1 Tax=Isoptericola jiangsuensis TaxID=548579 RepID=UPI003AAFBC07
MTRHPRFTVVVPAKDAGEFLADALTSLTRQVDDPDDLQVVVVDDGSSDDTAQVAGRFTSSLRHLDVITNPEAVGLASARNQGLGIARGRWIAYLDADDWMAPGRLPALARAATGLGCAWVRTDHVAVAGRERRLVRAHEPRRARRLDPTDSILPADIATMVDYPFAWAGLFDLAMASDGMLTFEDGLRTAEDRPWIWNLHLNGPSYAVVDAPALCYRRGVSSSLTQVFDERQLDFARAFHTARQTLDAHPAHDLYLGKYVRTVLAITAHHLIRVGRAIQEGSDEGRGPSYEGACRLEPALLATAAELLATLPAEQVEIQLQGTSDERQAALAPLLHRGAVGAADARRGVLR